MWFMTRTLSQEERKRERKEKGKGGKQKRGGLLSSRTKRGKGGGEGKRVAGTILLLSFKGR